jgi:hypothetical protein
MALVGKLIGRTIWPRSFPAVLTQSGLKRQGFHADVRSMIWWALVGAASWCLVALAGGVLVGRARDWGAAPLVSSPAAGYDRRRPTVPLPQLWERRAEGRVRPADEHRRARLSA